MQAHHQQPPSQPIMVGGPDSRPQSVVNEMVMLADTSSDLHNLQVMAGSSTGAQSQSSYTQGGQ